MSNTASARIGILVFARMSSSRLPGKVLLPFGDKELSLVQWILARASTLGLPVALATSIDKSDDTLAQHVESTGYTVFRGALNDVLQRALDAARFLGWSHFARLCADRPLFSLRELRYGLDRTKAAEEIDLLSNQLQSPAMIGLTTEVVRTGALAKAAMQAPTALQREHMTRYFYDHANAFVLENIPQDALGLTWRDKRFAVDTLDDYQWLRTLVGGYAPDVSLTALLANLAK